MARVTNALGRGGPPLAPASAPPAIVESTARVVQSETPLVTIFTQSATAVGMRVYSTAMSGVSDVIVGILQAGQVRSAAFATSEALSKIRESVRASGVQLLTQVGGGFASLYDCDAGVTDARAGVAETGSIVCVASAKQGRGLSLVPPLHVVVLRASDLVADLIDLWQPRGPIDLAESSNIVLITGPSKTADIEGVLITGVHGPREVHIVLVTDA